jgi:hypothetical protein
LRKRRILSEIQEQKEEKKEEALSSPAIKKIK